MSSIGARLNMHAEWNTMDEAVEGIRDIENNYDRHSKAARGIAEEYFDSDRVLGRLIEDTSCPEIKNYPNLSAIKEGAN